MAPGTEKPIVLTDVARDVLDWYRSAGVTAAVSDEPVDWLARGDRGPIGPQEMLQPPQRQQDASRSERAPAKGNPSKQAAPRSVRPPEADVRQTATRDDIGKKVAAAADLGALRAVLADFDGCPLKRTAKNLCFYRGAERADVMIIGEGPGREEDLSGLPFVGRAGKLLDRMLTAIRRSEQDTHITNVVYWRPPGNRTPTAAEVLACRPFLERQITLVDPKIIVAAGGAAAKSLLDTTTGIMKLRGRWKTINLGGQERPLMATLHPAYLLRTPAAKRMAWRDLLAIEQRLGELGDPT